ncbi:MAG: siderophore-interacting protein, partial [Haliea sp.]
MSTSSPSATPDRTPQRVRHELRRRTLDVLRCERLTPHMVRITLGGADLAGFSSPGFDDHVKLFFPDPVTGVLTLPDMHADAPRPDEDAPRPLARDYTPRHHDAAAGTLAIDFALHEAGPATQWALQAQPGQTLTMGGPRGSFILPTAFDWHLLVGDDTALPAIARRLAELPAGRA